MQKYYNEVSVLCKDLEELLRELDSNLNTTPKFDYTLLRINLIDLIKYNKNAPTKVTFVTHSSWEEIKDEPYGAFDYHFKCRKCGGRTPHKAYVVAPDYCPHCGSRMDKIEV